MKIWAGLVTLLARVKIGASLGAIIIPLWFWFAPSRGKSSVEGALMLVPLGAWIGALAQVGIRDVQEPDRKYDEGKSPED